MPSHPETIASAREALIHAAIDAFGRDGFDAVSIRRIARVAGVNPALISYYFSGKDGLYAACIKFIADQIAGRTAPLLADLQATLDIGSVSPAEALCQLADGMLALMTRPESAAWARIILREQQDPTEGFQVLFDGPMARIMMLATRLCALARGRTDTTIDDRLTAMSILGQVTFFRTHQAAVLLAMGWEEIDDDARTQVRRVIHQNIHRILEATDG